MKRAAIHLVSAGMVFLLIFGRAESQEGNQPVMGVDLGLYSRYIWRGLVYDQDPVLQPDIWMSAGRVTLCFWGSHDLTDEDGKYPGNYHEWDVFLDVILADLGLWSLTAELFYGSFPTSSGIGSSTAEIGLFVTGHVSGSPMLQVYWDIWQLHGIYVNYSLSHAFSLGPGMLSGYASLGWGDNRHNLWSNVDDAGGLLDTQIDLKYDIEAYPNLTVTPGVHFSAILQEDIRDAYEAVELDASNLFFSLSLAYLVTQ